MLPTLTNIPLLKLVASKRKPVILSTGASYLKEIDPKLIPYIKYGVLVEASKYKAVKAESRDTELRDSVNELGISVGDMKKYNKILEQINESN